MNNKILTREDAIKVLNESNGDVIRITQAVAAAIMNKSRQRVKQLVSHPEHCKSLGVEIDADGKITLDLKRVLEFKSRDEFRGKRGPQKKFKKILTINV
jgi:hypothetical protein